MKIIHASSIRPLILKLFTDENQKIAELKEYLKQQELQLQQNKKRFSLEDVVGDNKYLTICFD